MPMTKYFASIGLLLLLSFPLRADPLVAFGAEPVSGTATAFTLSDLEGKAHPLGQWQGKVVMLNFWATWCAPCRHEMPGMERLWQRYGDDGFVVVAVSVDEGMARRVANFVEILALTYPILLDPDYAVGDLYQVSGLPYTVLIDREGQLIAEVVGQREWDSTEAFTLIESLLSPGDWRENYQRVP